MLIIYPTDLYDSFVSVSDATTLISLNVLDIALWAALTDAKKEILLRQATASIKARIETDMVDDTTNLELATALLANYGVSVDLTSDNQSGNIKRKNVVGVIEKEYFTKGSKSNAYPTNVSDLLSGYGYTSGGSTITIERA